MAKRFFENSSIYRQDGSWVTESSSFEESQVRSYSKDWKIGMRYCPILEPFPRSNAPSKVFIDRRLVLSLLSNCFLCSLRNKSWHASGNFLIYSSLEMPVELPKLRMILNYFERCMNSIPKVKSKYIDAPWTRVRWRWRVDWNGDTVGWDCVGQAEIWIGGDLSWESTPVASGFCEYGVRFSSRLSLSIPHSHIRIRVVCSLVDVFKRKFDFQSLPSWS